MSEWKMFVWEYVLADYTDGMAFAIARNKKEAIKCLGLGKSSESELEHSKPKIHSLPGLQRKRPFGYYVYGGG